MDAETYDRLFKASGMTREELALRMGRKPTMVYAYIRRMLRGEGDDPFVADFIRESVLILREEAIKRSIETEDILRKTENLNVDLVLA